MGIVVVEGPDGSGKSTLIKALQRTTKRYYWTARSSGRPLSRQNLLDAVDLLYELALTPISIVLDRCFLISDPIYGPTLRRSSSVIDEYGTEGVRGLLLGRIERIIYCRPPLKAILDGVKAEDQLPGVLDRIEALVMLYDIHMKQFIEWGIEVIPYDWSFGQAKGTSWEQPSYEDLFWGKL